MPKWWDFILPRAISFFLKFAFLFMAYFVCVPAHVCGDGK